MVISASNSQTIEWILDWVTAFALVLSPILQHYNGLFFEAGTEMLIFAFPYTFLKLAVRKGYILKPVTPLAIYAIYLSIIHGFSGFTFARELLLLCYFIAAVNHCIDMRKYFDAAKTVAIFAFWLIVLQYFLYYMLQYHLRLVPVDQLLESASQWIGLANTGRISVTGARMSMYRPSAFFLEPSHLAIYCTPILTINLLSSDINHKKIRESVMISIAMILSTSGIGIVAAISVWLLYAVLYCGADEKITGNLKSKKKGQRAVIYVAVLLILISGLYIFVGIFRSAVNRIFLSADSDTVNAIQGRTSTGIRLIRMLSGVEIFFGKGKTLRIADWNVSGFFYTVFQYGWIGCILYYWFYIKGIIKLRREYFWLIALVVGLSFFTVHTFAAFYRMYFICLILGGYLQPEKIRR